MSPTTPTISSTALRLSVRRLPTAARRSTRCARVSFTTTTRAPGRGVGRCERPPVAQRDAERLEVGGRLRDSCSALCPRPARAVGLRTKSPPRRACERQRSYPGRGLHAGQRARSARAPRRSRPDAPAAVQRGRKLHRRERRASLVREAEVGVERVRHALHEEPGADEQDTGDCRPARSTSTLRKRLPVRSVISPPCAAQRRGERRPDRAERRQHAHQQRRERRDARSHRSKTCQLGDVSSSAACSAGKNDGSTSVVHAAINMPAPPAANASTAVSVSSWREQPRGAGAERAPDRDLPCAGRRPREEQAGDVGAGEDEHQPDAAHQDTADSDITCPRNSGLMRYAGVHRSSAAAPRDDRGCRGWSSGYSRASCAASAVSCACASGAE